MPQWKPKNKGGFDPQSVPVQLYPSVYVLQLEDGCYYVGLSTAGTGVEQRLTRHLMGIGANGATSWLPGQGQGRDGGSR
eukprot:COSAG01_NODE_58_length_30193_cov_12.302020_3_plen_79_part_00